MWHWVTGEKNEERKENPDNKSLYWRWLRSRLQRFHLMVSSRFTWLHLSGLYLPLSNFLLHIEESFFGLNFISEISRENFFSCLSHFPGVWLKLEELLIRPDKIRCNEAQWIAKFKQNNENETEEVDKKRDLLNSTKMKI